MMKRIWALLILLCIVNLTYASSSGEIIFGKWKVVAILDSAPISSLTDEQAKLVIGKYLIINKKEVRFQEKVGLSPVFTASIQNTFSCFYDGYRMDPVNLHLPETITEIIIDYEHAMGVYAVYPKNKNTIIFFWKGFFYKAIRSK